MYWLYAIIGGLIVGIIAQAIVKSDDSKGYGIASLIGIVGGVIGKIVLDLFHLPDAGGIVWNIVVAVIGAVILLWIYYGTRGPRTSTTT